MISCPICGSEISNTICSNCGFSVTETAEQQILNRKAADDDRLVLENGDSVIVVNEQSAWYNEIALICGRKHKFYKIELRGIRVWVPDDWIKQYDA